MSGLRLKRMAGYAVALFLAGQSFFAMAQSRSSPALLSESRYGNPRDDAKDDAKDDRTDLTIGSDADDASLSKAEQYDVASRAYQAGAFDRSAERFRVLYANADDPSSSFAMQVRYMQLDSEYRLAEVGQRDVHAIEEWLEEASPLFLDPKNAKILAFRQHALRTILGQLRQNQDYDRAISYAEQLLAGANGSSERMGATLLLAETLAETVSSGHPESLPRLIELYDSIRTNQAISIDDFFDCTLRLAKIALIQQAPDEASTLLEDLAPLPLSDKQLQQLGMLHAAIALESGEFDQAKRILLEIDRTALQVDSLAELLYMDFLVRRESQADTSGAITTLARLDSTHRYVGSAALSQAVSALKAGDLDGAFTASSKALDCNLDQPERIRATLVSAQIATRQSRWRDVCSLLEPLSNESLPDDLALQKKLMLAEAQYRLGQWTEDLMANLNELDRLASQTPSVQSDWPAVVGLRRAELLAHSEAWQEAFAVAEKTKNSFPDFTLRNELSFVMARCCVALVKFNTAKQLIADIVADPRSAETDYRDRAHWLLGEIFYLGRDYESAITAYSQVPPDSPYEQWVAAAMLQRAKCHEHLGQYAAAEPLYARLSSQFGDSPHARTARRRWTQLRANSELLDR